uniref:Uncharacterized protein n=1 Tax=Sphaerodactylus townsendi TaxID=933632 RepID=A0ACB8EMU5_9SAUR
MLSDQAANESRQNGEGELELVNAAALPGMRLATGLQSVALEPPKALLRRLALSLSGGETTPTNPQSQAAFRVLLPASHDASRLPVWRRDDGNEFARWSEPPLVIHHFTSTAEIALRDLPRGTKPENGALSSPVLVGDNRSTDQQATG